MQMRTYYKPVRTVCFSEFIRFAVGMTNEETVEQGLPEDMILKLQKMSQRQLQALTHSYSNDLIKVQVNIGLLRRIVDDIPAEKDDEVKFIELGASTPLMKKIFGLQRSEVTELKKKLIAKSDLGGRPACSDDTRQTIISLWYEKKNAELSEKERYLSVNKLLNIPLRIIHMVITQEENTNQSSKIQK